MDLPSNSQSNVDESPAEKMQRNYKRMSDLDSEILELMSVIEKMKIDQMKNFNRRSKQERREIMKQIQHQLEKLGSYFIEKAKLFHDINTFVDGQVRKVDENIQKSATEIIGEDIGNTNGKEMSQKRRY